MKILNSPTNALVCLKLFHPAFVSLFARAPQKDLEWILSQDGHFSSMTPGKGWGKGMVAGVVMIELRSSGWG